MAEERDHRGGGKSPDAGAERRARLERELRANLLKRKAQTRARKATPTNKEGGTEPPRGE